MGFLAPNIMRLEIKYDCSSESPREFAEHFSTIAYKSRYSIGEEYINEPIEWLEEKLGKPALGEYTNQRLEALEGEFYKEFIALPIYLYDHSGITISTSPFSCRWDSGKAGYIYVSKADARREYNTKRVSPKLRERIISLLESEVEEMDTYVRGEVYCFHIMDDDGNSVDSCHGFFGRDFVKNGMLDYIDHEILGISEDELITLLENIEVTY